MNKNKQHKETTLQFWFKTVDSVKPNSLLYFGETAETQKGTQIESADRWLKKYFGETAETQNGTQMESAEFKDTANIAILGMSDTSELTILDLSAKPDPTRTNEDHSQLSSIAHYLERPRIIFQSDWDPAGNFNNVNNVVTLNPWSLYIADSIQAKADNYSMMRAHALKVQFRVNGSPFHYGRLYAGYFPGPASNLPYPGMLLPNNVTLPPTNMGATLNALNFPLKTTLSQWPGVFIDPTTNQPQEMLLPFMYPYNYVSLLNATALQSMGTILIWVLAPLEHVNGATESITLTVTASLVEPILAMPTPATIYTGETKAGSGPPRPAKVNTKKKKQKPGKQGVQKDEYAKSNGVLSGPATAIAKFAGHLESVPFIGTYATATKIAASGISNIAKLFGYSRPAAIDDPTPMYYKPFGNLAVTSGSDNVAKLTLDPKQEITIDPVTVGLQSNDEMSFAHMFKRESLLLQCEWGTNSLANLNLFHLLVHPGTCPQHISTGAVKFETALSWATAPFEYWRGSLRYRIQVQCSQMHRGRLAFVYNPNAITSLGLPDLETSFVQIVDITEQRDFTLVVNWGSYKPWLPAKLIPGTYIATGSTGFVPVLRGMANGCLSAYVFNELASPNPTSQDILINVFVSAGDDFQVAAPSSEAIELQSYTSTFMEASYGETFENHGRYPYYGESFDPTVGTENTPSMLDKDIILNGSDGDEPDVDDMNLVFFGEQNVSLRALLKRYCMYRDHVAPAITGTNCVSWRMTNPRLPAGYGLPSFLSGPMPYSATGPVAFNYVHQTLLYYYMMGFLANRGAVRYKYIAVSMPNQNISSWHASRRTFSTVAPLMYEETLTNDVTSGANFSIRVATALSSRIDDTNNIAGHHMTVHAINGGIEFEVPWYAPMRFLWNTYANPQAVPTTLVDPDFLTNYFLRHDCHDVTIQAPTATFSINSLVESQVAAGEDFSLHYFLGAPPTSFQAVPAGAV